MALCSETVEAESRLVDVGRADLPTLGAILAGSVSSLYLKN